MLRIRVDDFPGTKPEEFDRHNVKNFLKFHDVMRSHGVSYVLGVIPVHTTMAAAGELSTYYSITFAMHGIIHDETKKCEFNGIDPVAAAHTLWLARAKLSTMFKTEVTDYIPPHNEFGGRDMLRAIRTAGFTDVYGGPETSADDRACMSIEGLKYNHSEFPYTYGRSDEMLAVGAGDIIRSMLARGDDVCVTFHWTWEHNLCNDYKTLAKFLKKITC